MQSWPLFNLAFSNVQLILDKKKTILVMLYSYTFNGEQISSWEFFVSQWLLCETGLFEAYGKQQQQQSLVLKITG